MIKLFDTFWPIIKNPFGTKQESRFNASGKISKSELNGLSKSSAFIKDVQLDLQLRKSE